MTSERTRALLALALAGTLGAAYFAPAQESSDLVAPPRTRPAASVEAKREPVRASSAASSQVQVQVLALRARDDDEPEEVSGRLFSAAAPPAPPPLPPAQPAPPPVKPVTATPAPPPPPPPLPQAPPLPFKVLGRYVDEGRTAVFLSYQDRSLVARVGDTLLHQYRVESVAGRTMTLRYLPLEQQQSIDIGEPL